MTEIVFELPGGPLAAHFARSRLPDGLLPAPRAAMLDLLLSELVTNAVRHGGASEAVSMKIAISRTLECLTVSVTDAGPGFDWHGDADGRPPDEGGFGLLLVGRMASRWGINRTHESTTVWFELD